MDFDNRSSRYELEHQNHLMQLGEFFTLDELTTTSQPFLNQPQEFHLVNLVRLVTLVLDPLRRLSGPLHVNSGFRNEKVNAAVGGVHNSFHTKGLAADIRSDTLSPADLARLLGGLEFDKAIDEYGRWLHVQIAPIGSPPRGELLRKTDKGYSPL